MTGLNQKHVFVSYSRKNSKIVDKLVQTLKSFGINVWLDREKLNPGERWEYAIEQAIQEGAFFIACFSKQYIDGTDGVRFEELNIAIERLRRKPDSHVWFIPVLLNKCEIPNMDIRKGQKLSSLHYTELYKNWDRGIDKILSVVQSRIGKFSKVITNRYVDTLIDYVDGATVENDLHLEVAVKKDGEIAAFYDKPFKVDFLRAEFFESERMLVFLTKEGSRRSAGLPLTESMTHNLINKSPEKILMIYQEADDDGGELQPIEGFYLPLDIYQVGNK